MLHISLILGVVFAATKIVTPDHDDPMYTDVCYEVTREMCDFCCLVDFEFCARDIGICEPPSGRNLKIIAHCVLVFSAILCGIPICVKSTNCFMNRRCFRNFFPETNGASCFDLIMRFLCLCFCCISFEQHHRIEEDLEM